MGALGALQGLWSQWAMPGLHLSPAVLAQQPLCRPCSAPQPLPASCHASWVSVKLAGWTHLAPWAILAQPLRVCLERRRDVSTVTSVPRTCAQDMRGMWGQEGLQDLQDPPRPQDPEQGPQCCTIEGTEGLAGVHVGQFSAEMVSLHLPECAQECLNESGCAHVHRHVHPSVCLVSAHECASTGTAYVSVHI